MLAAAARVMPRMGQFLALLLRVEATVGITALVIPGWQTPVAAVVVVETMLLRVLVEPLAVLES